MLEALRPKLSLIGLSILMVFCIGTWIVLSYHIIYSVFQISAEVDTELVIIITINIPVIHKEALRFYSEMGLVRNR
jgi:hypothetical protein